MSELEKIDFLIKLLNKEKFTLSLEESAQLLQAYKWLYELSAKAKEKK
jgi:hypothetical protein